MRYLILSALLALAACGDNKTPLREDAGVEPADAAPDAGQPARGPCLDHPTDLPRPSEQLPCDMLPPGFVQP
jgi:hypothetical protein